MAPSAFCRYFMKYAKKTFAQFVNEFRSSQTIRTIKEGNKPKTEVGGEIGFNHFSHFN